MQKNIKIKTKDCTLTEKWETSDKYCPNCGNKTLWKINKIASDTNFNGIKFKSFHICTNCKVKFDGTIENLEHIDIILEWDLERFYQIKGNHL